MGTTTEELKKLYAKLGGTDPNIPKASTPGEVLNGINELELGGDKLPEVTEADNGKALGVKQGQWDKMDVDIELPDVTTDDNGKVLMVSEGNWGKGDLPKVGDIVFDCTGDYLDSNWTLKNNKTIGNIFSILSSNVPTNVYLRGYIRNNDIYTYTYLKCTAYASVGGTARTMFVGICRWNFSSSTFYRDTAIIESYFDNSSPNNFQIPVTHRNMLPPVNSSDNDKILKVVSGEWKKVTAPSELPAVTSSDNGNVLTVVNGAWASAAASGGDLVRFDVTTNGTSRYVTFNGGKTISDFNACISSGKIPFIVDENGRTYYYQGKFSGIVGNDAPALFSTKIQYSQSAEKYVMTISAMAGSTVGNVTDGIIYMGDIMTI